MHDSPPRAPEPARGGRDWFYAEVGLLLATLIAGAALRYWLSTVLPFDDWELAVLADASVVDRGLRVAFIMLNGASLFALYLFVRRSAGVHAAFAVLLLLQTSLTFQEQALRVRLPAMVILPVVVVATYLRFQAPARRLSARFVPVILGLVAVLCLRGAYLMATLPGRIADLRATSAADPMPLYAAVVGCGGGVVTPAQTFAGCDIAWPSSRSLDQQELMFAHRSRLGADAVVLTGPTAPSLPDGAVVVFDPAAAVFIAVPAGALEETTLAVVRGAEPGFPHWAG